MTATGLAFMAISWAVIIGLNVFCFTRLRAENNVSRPESDD
jgi:hypothetical protein